MAPLTYEMQAQVTPYAYIGDEPSFGSTQLTMLAQSFEKLIPSDLDFLFPTLNVYERTLVIEQLIESHAIMPPAVAGIPNGQFLEPNRLRRFSVTPQPFREDDFVDMMYVNQLRRPGSINERMSAQEWISKRVEELVSRHRRTKSIFQAKMLLGGWQYKDPRTNVSINANSNIPAHNFFSYKGWNGTVAADVDVNIMGRNYRTLTALTPAKGRHEASFFTSSDYKIGVPWTYPQANITQTLLFLKNYLWLTNKNKFDTIVMSSQLLAVIQTINEYLKTWQGFPGMLAYNAPTNTIAGNAVAAASNSSPNPMMITFGPGGDIATLAGMRVVTLDGMWKNPANNNQYEVYWPTHKVALVASKSMSNPSATLGYTYHCSGESPNGTPGLWMKTTENAPLPAPEGIMMRIGDCFIPFPVYPHWIAVLDVAEPQDLYTSLPLLPDLAYGTF